jgi:FAD/FMN-containing dehydrogenase
MVLKNDTFQHGIVVRPPSDDDGRMEARTRVVGTRSHPARLNDVHSGLNATCVSRVLEAQKLNDIVRAVQRARTERRAMAIAGGRHAMGGQQFLSGGILLDMRGMNRVRRFDEERGLLEVEAGIQWPAVLRAYLGRPGGIHSSWGICQKQTGADRLTIGGAVAANIHGRCLTARPFIDDLESLEVVSAEGDVMRCSRSEHPSLFRHVVGGYGLFGVVTAATLRLVRRQQVERIVELCEIDALLDRLTTRIAAGLFMAISSLPSIIRIRIFFARAFCRVTSLPGT